MRCRFRQQDLTAMADPAHACAAVDRQTVVIAITDFGLARVEADSYSERPRCRPRLAAHDALDGHSRHDGVDCRRKDSEAAIALTARADMNTAMLADGRLEESVVPSECLRHGV